MQNKLISHLESRVIDTRSRAVAMGCGASKTNDVEALRSRRASQVQVDAVQRAEAAYRRQRMAFQKEATSFRRASIEIEKARIMKEMYGGGQDKHVVHDPIYSFGFHKGLEPLTETASLKVCPDLTITEANETENNEDATGSITEVDREGTISSLKETEKGINKECHCESAVKSPEQEKTSPNKTDNTGARQPDELTAGTEVTPDTLHLDVTNTSANKDANKPDNTDEQEVGKPAELVKPVSKLVVINEQVLSTDNIDENDSTEDNMSNKNGQKTGEVVTEKALSLSNSRADAYDGVSWTDSSLGIGDIRSKTEERENVKETDEISESVSMEAGVKMNILTVQQANHQPDWTEPTADQSADDQTADNFPAGPEFGQFKEEEPASSISSFERKSRENESLEETGAETEPRQTAQAAHISTEQQQVALQHEQAENKNNLLSGPPLVDVGAA